LTFDKIDSFHKIKVLCLNPSMNPTWVKLRLTQAGYLHRYVRINEIEFL